MVSRGTLEGDELGLEWPDSGSNDEEGQEEEEEEEFSFPIDLRLMGGTVLVVGDVGGRGLDALEDFKSFVGVDDGRGREEEEEAAPPETMGDAVISSSEKRSESTASKMDPSSDSSIASKNK